MFVLNRSKSPIKRASILELTGFVFDNALSDDAAGSLGGLLLSSSIPVFSCSEFLLSAFCVHCVKINSPRRLKQLRIVFL